jgi:hypothetical protein
MKKDGWKELVINAVHAFESDTKDGNALELLGKVLEELDECKQLLINANIRVGGEPFRQSIKRAIELVEKKQCE